MDFDLRQLEIFCRVIEHKSFSQAAKSLHLAQASVSERISTLENMVGTRLLDRLGRQAVPTKAGEILYRRALELLEKKRETCQEIENFLGIRRGEITIGASTIPGEYILPKLIRRYRGKYPEISVRMKIGDTEEINIQVEDGSLEFGVVGSKGGDKTLNYQELWKDDLVLVIPPDHKWSNRKSVRLRDLLEEPIILRETGSGTRKILEEHLRGKTEVTFDTLNIIAVLGSSTAVKEGVRAGLGISIISSRAVDNEARSGDLKVLKISDLSIKRSFYLVLDKRRIQSPLAKSFADFLLKHISSI